AATSPGTGRSGRRNLTPTTDAVPSSPSGCRMRQVPGARPSRLCLSYRRPPPICLARIQLVEARRFLNENGSSGWIRTSNPPVNRSGPENLQNETKRDEDDENQ